MTTRDEIIAMADEVGIKFQSHYGLANQLHIITSGSQSIERIEQFAALAISRDRQRLTAVVDFPEITHFPCDRRMGYTLDQLRDYGDRRAAAEREACAKVLDAAYKVQEARRAYADSTTLDGANHHYFLQVMSAIATAADTIRARIDS